VNLLWTKGEEFVPVCYRIEQKENDSKANDHFQEMLKKLKNVDLSRIIIL